MNLIKKIHFTEIDSEKIKWHSGIFLNSTVLRYKWEAYCDTNGTCTAIQMGGLLKVLPFPERSGHRNYCITNWRLIATQIGGVLRYFLRSSGGCGF